MSSTACWSWDARSPSVSPEPQTELGQLHPNLRSVQHDCARGLFDEAAAVAAAAGHAPRAGFVQRMRDMERGNRIEADHIVGDLIARGMSDDTRLLRIAHVHLKSYEARRLREAK